MPSSAHSFTSAPILRWLASTRAAVLITATPSGSRSPPQIPASEYHQVAAQFNPSEFDAEQWVQVFKDAGIRYVVITSKHHDGFALFKSLVSPYNIVDATQFKRDIIKEL